MAAGTLASIMAGITFPFFLMYFGQITSLFDDPTTATDKGLDILIKFLIIGSLYWVLSTSLINQPLQLFRAGATQVQPRVCD